MPCVSILVTTFNNGKFLGDSISSILNSTYQDFEVIIVDDCSRDDTYQIALDLSKHDSRIKVYKNETNLGDYVNRNMAASFATGKYIKYVDADDIIYRHALDAMIYYMNSFPQAGYGLCRPPSRSTPYPICLNPRKAYLAHFLGDGLFGNAPLSSIINRRCFMEIGCFSGQRYFGDTEMWLRLSSRFDVVVMPSDLTWWRDHASQETKREKGVSVWKDRVKIELLYLADFNDFSHQEKMYAANSLKIRILKSFLLQLLRRPSMLIVVKMFLLITIRLPSSSHS